VGANKAYIEKEIPHISRLLSTDLDEVTSFAEVVVVGHGTQEFREAVGKLDTSKIVIDLARVDDVVPEGVAYDGINW